MIPPYTPRTSFLFFHLEHDVPGYKAGVHIIETDGYRAFHPLYGDVFSRHSPFGLISTKIMYVCSSVVLYDKGESWRVMKTRYSDPTVLENALSNDSAASLMIHPDPIARRIGKFKHEGVIS